MANEKNIEINRCNQALLNKLVEISTGKWSCVPHARDRSADAGRSSFRNFKSLNLPYRKRETERIERENHAFAKRLFERPANLSKKKFDEEYQTHLVYKRQIQKLKLSTSALPGVSTVGASANQTSAVSMSDVPQAAGEVVLKQEAPTEAEEVPLREVAKSE